MMDATSEAQCKGDGVALFLFKIYFPTRRWEQRNQLRQGSERIHLDRGLFPERDETQNVLKGESDESHPKLTHICCISTQIHTEVSNDLICDKITSRVILAKFDVNHLSKETSDVEYRKISSWDSIFGNIDAKISKAVVESPTRGDPLPG